MIYIISFFLVITIVFIGQKTNKLGKIASLFIVILIISVLFGLRDRSIGTDTQMYVSSIWDIANHYSSFSDFSRKILYGSNVEELYVVWNYAVSRVSNNFNFYLFTTGFFLYALFLFAMYRLKKNISLPIALYIFLFVFFRESLNVLRQYLAIGFCFLSFSYLLENKYKTATTWGILAYGFHHSAIIYLCIVLLKKITSMYHDAMQRRKSKIVIIGIIIFSLISLAYILNFFETIGFIDSRYAERYADSTRYGTNVPISLFAISLVNIICFKCITKKMRNHLLTFFEYLLIIAFVLCFSGLISTFAVRMGTYFQITTIVIFSYLYKNVKTMNVRKVKICHFIFIAIYWLLTVVIANLGSTFPYKSEILGI